MITAMQVLSARLRKIKLQFCLSAKHERNSWNKMYMALMSMLTSLQFYSYK